ncbi:hypothetical protein PTKIN_Ptkin08bG0042200 [Pterospermum kingtungense]
MASKAIPFFSFTLLLVLPLLFQALLADLKDKKPSPFEFLQHLQGCHKGDKVKDINKLKNYLENFGYLRYKNNSHANDDYFDAISPLGKAFQTWAAYTHFSFSWTEDYVSADIRVSFQSSDHGDGNEFDAETLAHAFAPTNGTFHYNADLPWFVNAISGSFHLETVALHEIGHLLGLHHSFVEDAVMYPTIMDGETKGLHADDVQGIKVLYNY